MKKAGGCLSFKKVRDGRLGLDLQRTVAPSTEMGGLGVWQRKWMTSDLIEFNVKLNYPIAIEITKMGLDATLFLGRDGPWAVSTSRRVKELFTKVFT